MKLIDFVIENPWLLLIVVSWLVSAMGGVMQKAAKKAAEQQRRAGQQPTADREDADPAVAARRRGEVVERRRLVEQRRVEQLQSRRGAMAAPPIRRVEAPQPPPMPVEVVQERRMSLSEELAQKERARRQRVLATDRARDAHLGESVTGRHLDIHSTEGALARRPRGRGKGGGVPEIARLVDLGRPARAFVAMEVLGTPVGLRDRPIGRPYS